MTSELHSYNLSSSYSCWVTARLLIGCGADVDTLDVNKNTPLHLLVQNSPSLDFIMVSNILCDFDAHLDHVNNQRQIPLRVNTGVPK